MSRLAELIRELCPDGVEYKKIEDCTLKTYNIKWKQTEGEYRYIDLSSVDRDTSSITETTIIDADNAPSRAQQIVQTDDIIFATTRPLLKRYCMIPPEYDGQIASTGFCVLRADTSIVLPRWLFFNIASREFYGFIEPLQVEGNYPSVSNGNVKAFKVPVPPLEIQHEIIRILDKLTSLKQELDEQLSKELSARRKQYEYYRDELLTFGDDVPKIELGDICDVIVGGEAPNDCIKVKDASGDYIFPIWANGQDVYGYAKTYTVEKDAVCISSIGANTGAVFFHKGRFTPIIRLKVLIPKMEGIDVRYLFHAVSTVNFAPKKSSVPNMSAKDIKVAKIGLPSLERQEEIACLLDKYDDLTTNIVFGLPAEIEARRKQYEYYRDKLLTFKRKK